MKTQGPQYRRDLNVFAQWHTCQTIVPSWSRTWPPFLASGLCFPFPWSLHTYTKPPGCYPPVLPICCIHSLTCPSSIVPLFKFPPNNNDWYRQLHLFPFAHRLCLCLALCLLAGSVLLLPCTLCSCLPPSLLSLLSYLSLVSHWVLDLYKYVTISASLKFKCISCSSAREELRPCVRIACVHHNECAI